LIDETPLRAKRTFAPHFVLEQVRALPLLDRDSAQEGPRSRFPREKSFVSCWR
jgi:hypothetical protein